ncbi:c-type cytochrome [bacterium]|nr:c-type cytochrome [bacterium]
MSDKKEPGIIYNMSKLNKVFAFLSFLLLMTVFWVFMDDYVRPWKAIQIKAMQIKKDKVTEDIKKAQGEIDPQALKEIEEKIESATNDIEPQKEKIEKAEAQIADVDIKLTAQKIDDGEYNAKVTALTFQYESAFSHYGKDASKTQKLFKKLRKYKSLLADSKDKIKGLESEKKAFNGQITEIKKDLIAAKKALEEMKMKKSLLMLADNKLAINPIFFIRNAPFLDFLDPTIKIKQIVLDNIKDDRYFRDVYKVDRCITCHEMIDQVGFEDQENPYKTHPHLDLMVGSKSKHPMKQVGCTVCHGGEGHRVYDFSAAAHMPNNEEQHNEWVEKYNYHEPHKVPEAMYKTKYAWATCTKCHTGVERIPGGEKVAVNEGIRNIEKFGCYGCHKIDGWEHKRTPGPSLEKVASKISKDFFKSWVWAPKSFNKHAKMPSFFMQDNNSKPKFRNKNITEVNAMAEYIWNKSKEYEPHVKYTGGDVAKGKTLIGEVGCLSCHGVEGFEEQSKKVDAYAGPYLTGSGTKLDPNWTVSWLIKPNHYQENTIMPSFRLSTKEANDITAYLMTLKSKSFNSLEFEKLNPKLRDDILVGYFSAFATQADAKKKLENMSERERTLELGFRSIGKYGCYSCHSIEGFDGRLGIGPELSKIGSKPITQFGFGHEDVKHDRDSWIKAHLINPKRWDADSDKAFADLNRMPNYYMTEKESESITEYLIGLVDQDVSGASYKLSAGEQSYQKAWKEMNRLNCTGCHKVDGYGGDILKAYEDEQEGPPWLVKEGHRVRTEWLYGFLDNVYTMRPWLKVRMPSYHYLGDMKDVIVEGLAKGADQDIFSPIEKVSWEPGEREAAKALWESYACASCHTNGFNNEEPSAPNLFYSKTKNRTSWIKKWLRNPQAIIPSTPMPNFFEDGEAQDDTILNGDVEKQINALTKYVLEFGHNEYFWQRNK